MKKIAIAFITLYQWTLSPIIGNQCRFYPTCSQYSKEALKKYGFFKGLWLTTLRIFRCHPWSQGGVDIP
jgi:uncharacterized protein